MLRNSDGCDCVARTSRVLNEVLSLNAQECEPVPAQREGHASSMKS